MCGFAFVLVPVSELVYNIITCYLLGGLRVVVSLLTSLAAVEGLQSWKTVGTLDVSALFAACAFACVDHVAVHVVMDAVLDLVVTVAFDRVIDVVVDRVVVVR